MAATPQFYASLRLKLLVVVFSTLLPALGVLAWTAHQWRRHEISDAEALTLQLASHLTSEFEREIAAERGAVESRAHVAASALRVFGLEVLAPPGTAITIFDDTGRIVARQPDSDWVGRVIADDAIVRTAVTRRAEGTTEAASVDQMRRVIAYRPLAASGARADLFVMVEVPIVAATAKADRILAQAYAWFLFAMVVTAAVASFGCDRLVQRPVQALIDTTERLGHGDMTARATLTNAPTELRQLANSVDDMAAALQAREGEARGARARTEQTIEKLTRAIEQTADSVFITDAAGVIEYVNPAFEAMTGYSSEEVVGQTPRLLRSGHQTATFFQMLWRTILAGHVFRAVVVNRTKDGLLYDEDQTITPIRDASGVVTHFVATGRDVTQRKRAQEALRRLNQQLELEASRIAGVIHDQAGQFLASAHLMLAEASREAAPAVRGRLDQIRHVLGQIEQQLRSLSHEIHPHVVEDVGLVEAVRYYADAFARRTGVRIEVNLSVDQRYPLAVETLMYRVVQEGLVNISRHAHADARVCPSSPRAGP